MKTLGTAIVSVAISLLACSGCTKLDGTVMDGKTGEPIPDATVGMWVPRPLASPEFRALESTNEGGAFSFYVLGEGIEEVAIRKDTYVSITQTISELESTAWSVDLYPIEPIEGPWDVYIDAANGSMPVTQLEFNKDRVFWRVEGRILAIGHYTFDGTVIVIEDNIATGDVAYGRMLATLQLDPDSGQLWGEISFESISAGTPGIVSPNNGDVVATRPKS